MKVSLHFGALADPIKRQLLDQGFATRDVELWQKLADSIVMLAVHSYIGQRESERLRRKLMKQVMRGLS